MKLRMHQHLLQQSQSQMPNLTFSRLSDERQLTSNYGVESDDQPMDLSIPKQRFRLPDHLSPSNRSRSSSVTSSSSICHASPFTSPAPLTNTSTGTLLSPPNSIEEDDEDSSSYKRLNQAPTISLCSSLRAARLAQRARLHSVANHHQQPPSIQTLNCNLGLGTVLELPQSSSSYRPAPYSIPAGSFYTPLLTTAKPFNPMLYRQSPSPIAGALTSDSPSMPVNIQPAHLQRPSPRRPTPPLPDLRHRSAGLLPNTQQLPPINTIPAHSKQPPFLSGKLASLPTQCQNRTFSVTSPVSPEPSDANAISSIALCEKLLAEQMQKARMAAAELVRAHLRAQGLKPLNLPTENLAPFTNSSTGSTASLESDACSIPSAYSPPPTSLLAARLNQLHCTNVTRTSPTSMYDAAPMLTSRPGLNSNHMSACKPEYRRERSPLPSHMQLTTSLDSCSDSGEGEEFDQRSRRLGGRPLTGRHVRPGTGASASTLASLRKLLNKRLRNKQNTCTPSTSKQTKSFPYVTLVN